ncbi:MAG: zinc ribbon domain-containing protein [Vallitaleaceae bacterium]|nr:zinc ribbon domain-containing protein [Vallitaleaceae bacterium]
MFCEQCGKQMPDESVFCPNCGAKNTESETVQEISAAQAAVEQPVVQPIPVVQPKPVTQSKPAPQPVQQQVQPQYVQQPVVPSADLTKPISILGYMGTIFLLALPIVGLVMMFVWAFGSKVNKNRKNLSIALLIFLVIEIVLAIVFGATAFVFINDMIDKWSY